jgi:hypothetical protein
MAETRFKLTRVTSATRPITASKQMLRRSVSNLTLHTMYGRSQRAGRWDVPRTNGRTQRMDRFSNSRCVFSCFHRLSNSIYVLCTSISSTSFATLTPSQHLILFLLKLQCLMPLFITAQTPSFPSTKRRRLYGLNSRFDRMLQEVSWASDATKSFPPRHKRAYSPSSSSMTNHDLPKTPTDTPTEIGCGSRKLGKCFVPTTPENRLSATTLQRSACLSPSHLVKTGNQVFSSSLHGHIRVGNLLSHSRSS